MVHDSIVIPRCITVSDKGSLNVLVSLIAGRNMSIILKVDKNRSLSIEFHTNQSTNIGNR